MVTRHRSRSPRAVSALRTVVVAAGLVLLPVGCAGTSDGGAASDGGGSGTAGASPGAGSSGPPALEAGASVVGVPDAVGTPPADAVAGAARTADDALIYVVTFGSSTCPSVADPDATSTGASAVEVTFPAPGDGPCTADYLPATTVVALPDVSDGDLEVTIGTWGTVTLPAGSREPAWATTSG